MIERTSVLAVGASVATAALVSQLRTDGFDGRIIVVDRDPDMPYDRPPLSKDFLTSDAERPEAPWWSSECDHVVGTVEALHAGAKVATISLGDGSLMEVAADHVVIASGSEPVSLPGQPDGVAVLRTATDARAIREVAAPGKRIVILGAGTVGTELASSLTAAGADVSLVDMADRPLDRFLAGHLGKEAAAWIREAGVRLLLGQPVTAIDRSDEGWSVDVGGQVLQADMVVSAIGTRPAVGWLVDSGLLLENGVLCDADGQAITAAGDPAPGLFAIGDVANWMGSDGIHRRREDWTSAQRQGRHVARRLLGREPVVAADAERDYFWSNQFGRRIQVLGRPLRDGALVRQVEDPERKAAFFTVDHEDLANGATSTVAWISINRPREFALAMRQSAAAASAS